MRSEAISDEDENVLSTVHCKGLIILISIRYSNRMYPQRKCHLCVVLIYSYKNVAAILTFLCFELEQIHGPFFFLRTPLPICWTKWSRIWSNSKHSWDMAKLRCIQPLGHYSYIPPMLWVRADPKPLLPTNRAVLRKQRGLGFTLTQSIKNSYSAMVVVVVGPIVLKTKSTELHHKIALSLELG